ncbi:hypothetical protein EJ02DRAFT_245307 [Clathrospora elynae]|uniref:Uncharacterized protein n=1 Tax=Clathrospora elynae TaxID=706981 RepID=A0A6A5SJF4_9PLEO|nr:hypothetical protein EJ02DRAFT_245307 [Clathrospora elynae]
MRGDMGHVRARNDRTSIASFPTLSANPRSHDTNCASFMRYPSKPTEMSTLIFHRHCAM